MPFVLLRLPPSFGPLSRKERTEYLLIRGAYKGKTLKLKTPKPGQNVLSYLNGGN
jgi:hypothetical protein